MGVLWLFAVAIRCVTRFQISVPVVVVIVDAVVYVTARRRGLVLYGIEENTKKRSMVKSIQMRVLLSKPHECSYYL